MGVADEVEQTKQIAGVERGAAEHGEARGGGEVRAAHHCHLPSPLSRPRHHRRLQRQAHHVELRGINEVDGRRKVKKDWRRREGGQGGFYLFFFFILMSLQAPPESFPMPAESSQHAMQCALDVGEFGLWVGTMNTANPLMRYHTYVYLPLFLPLFFPLFCPSCPPLSLLLLLLILIQQSFFPTNKSKHECEETRDIPWNKEGILCIRNDLPSRYHYCIIY